MKNPSSGRDGTPDHPPSQKKHPAAPGLRCAPCSTGLPKRTQGVALVVTLLCLVLLVVLAVGFLGNVATNRTASATEHGIALTQSLSESAVELVKAQITEGTKSQSPTGADLAWASQPGMIRTFQVGGTPGTYYKLYSATEMVKNGSSYANNEDAPTNAGNTAVWADLNRPVLNSDGTTLSYPIVNPDAVGKVEGFACNATAAWGYDSSRAASPANNPAPMPVRWLYVLQDGRMVPAVASGNTSVTVAGATAANPIIGRVAFWTDDDTSKVNLNTAAEGTFWDVPRANTATERLFSSLQPVKNEFQRFPGHPSMTSLSSVFGSWLPIPASVTSGNYPSLSKYYQLAPRINDTTSSNSGGTLNGTLAGTQNLDTAMSALAVDTDRLYASTDEFIFSALGTAPSSATPRASNDTALSRQVIESTRFFTTTDSRSPDVNLFGQPRITIWPLRPTGTAANALTPQDQLISFCSTIGGRRYAFTRSNSNNQTTDFTGRNTELFAYLQSVTARPVPGFPNGTFALKYPGGERDQILTNIFDYIRSSAPLYAWSSNATENLKNFTSIDRGTYMVVPISIGGQKGFGSFKTISEVNVLFYAWDQTSAGLTERYMRAVVLPQLYFPHIAYTDWSDFRIQISGIAPATVTTSLDPSTAQSLRFVDGLNNWLSGAWNLQGAGTFGGPYGFAAMLATNRGTTFPSGAQYTPKYLGRSNEQNEYPFYSDPIRIPNNSVGNFTFSGFPTMTIQIRAMVNPNGPTAGPDQLVQTININFPGGTLPYPSPTAESYPDGNSNWAAAQTFANQPSKQLTNPSGGPTLVSGGTPMTSFNARCWSPYFGNWPDNFYFTGDVVRSVVIDPSGPARGDVRMVAGLNNVPSNYFAPLAGSGPLVHNIRTSRPISETGLTPSGSVVAGISNYNTIGGDSRPFVPPGLTAAILNTPTGGPAPGDWDTGVANFPDGAGINLPDNSGSQGAMHFAPLGTGSLGLMGSVFYSPNRSMPSPVTFGSLPTGIQGRNPWQTLLFCPNSAAAVSGAVHPGSVNPPDHLLLDLFKMPVVEPYAISDPFSTAGKINLNYQIAPFSHITRKTGIQALLKSARLFAVPDADVSSYKLGNQLNLSGPNLNRFTQPPAAGDYRLRIDLNQTTAAFDAKFDGGDIFRSATQLCEMFLYPVGTTYDAAGTNIRNFWSTRRLTGDNMRENPYRDLYGRVTTQSNSYTVHYIVQALKKSPSGTAGVWNEGSDKVISEYRGSTSIERYIDPQAARLTTDFATAPTSTPSAANRLDSFYRIRTLGNRRFAP